MIKIKRIFACLFAAAFLCSVVLSALSCARVEAAELTGGEGITAAGKAADEKFTQAGLGFSLSLFSKTAATDKSKNLLISPLSVLLALSLAANGASGETLAEMEETLGLTVAEMNEYLAYYAANLPDGKKCKINTANSLWVHDDGSITVKDAFLQNAADYYGAQVYGAPFDAGTVKDINKWIKDNTDGLIDRAVEKIDAETVLYIINALVFDAEWTHIYERSDIKKGVFHAMNGEEHEVKFMHSHEGNCFRKEDAEGFIKYYSGGKYAFVGVLPEGDVYEYTESLTPEKFADLFVLGESYGERYAEVYLPKFDYDYSVEMKEILSSMGMDSAFGTEADFSALGETKTGVLKIDEVLHKTYISVDERGTKAGAVTVIKGGCGSAAPSEEMRFDRPFVYFIVDVEAKLPVFMGIAADIGE